MRLSGCWEKNGLLQQRQRGPSTFTTEFEQCGIRLGKRLNVL